ncbi:MAG: hypothetical protein KGZ72_02240 [Roseovarius sp.]|jgi:hypothetical protein|nr:hypothetical protein [Roseovarius sp.]
MIRVSVTLHPPGGRPREIAAAAIGQCSKGAEAQRTYAALLATDGKDDVPAMAAVVRHDRDVGVWQLVRAVIDTAECGAVDRLPPALREALARLLLESDLS